MPFQYPEKKFKSFYLNMLNPFISFLILANSIGCASIFECCKGLFNYSSIPNPQTNSISLIQLNQLEAEIKITIECDDPNSVDPEFIDYLIQKYTHESNLLIQNLSANNPEIFNQARTNNISVDQHFSQ